MKHGLAGQQVLTVGSLSRDSRDEDRVKLGASDFHDGDNGTYNRFNLFQNLIWESYSPLVNFIHSSASYASGAGLMLKHMWNRPKKAINLSISCLRKMVMEVASILTRQRMEGIVGRENDSTTIVSKNRITERLLQEGLPPGTIPIQRSCQSICRFIERDPTSFEIHIDVDSVPMWKGWVCRNGHYLDLNLEHLGLDKGGYDNHSGILLLDDHSLDTGRYLIVFQDATTISIFDRLSSVSTTLLGRPDMPGVDEADPFELSGTRLTLALLDGSRLVVDAPEGGIIGSVDVFKNDVHFRGTGRVRHHDGLDSTKGTRSCGSIARILRSHLDRIGGVFTEMVPAEDNGEPLDKDTCLAAV